MHRRRQLGRLCLLARLGSEHAFLLWAKSSVHASLPNPSRNLVPNVSFWGIPGAVRHRGAHALLEAAEVDCEHGPRPRQRHTRAVATKQKRRRSNETKSQRTTTKSQQTARRPQRRVSPHSNTNLRSARQEHTAQHLDMEPVAASGLACGPRHLRRLLGGARAVEGVAESHIRGNALRSDRQHRAVR